MFENIRMKDYLKISHGEFVIKWDKVEALKCIDPEEYNNVIKCFEDARFVTKTPYGSIGIFDGAFNIGPIRIRKDEEVRHDGGEKIIHMYFTKINYAKQYKKTAREKGLNPTLLSIERKVID